RGTDSIRRRVLPCCTSPSRFLQNSLSRRAEVTLKLYDHAGRPLGFLRRVLGAVFLGGLVWAGLVLVTGGVQFHAGRVFFSSRRPGTPLLIALAAAVGFVASTWHEGREGFAREWEWWRRTPSRAVVWTRSHMRELLGAVPAVLALFVIGVQVYRWTGAEPLWIDEEAIAITVREHSFSHLAGPVWLA